MAKIHGLPGEWARVRGVVWGLWPLFLGAAALGFAVATAAFGRFTWGLAVLAAALVWNGLWLMRGLRRVERFFKGARGEERVSGILAGLPDAYHVFNDFVAGREHIDHVVVGPAGVFAVETKFWRDEVTVEEGYVLRAGRMPDRDPLVQVRREADLVRRTLAKAGWQGAVTPVLAFASDTFTAHRAELNGAVVLNSSELNGSFGTKMVVIPPNELERLVGLMEALR